MELNFDQLILTNPIFHFSFSFQEKVKTHKMNTANENNRPDHRFSSGKRIYQGPGWSQNIQHQGSDWHPWVVGTRHSSEPYRPG